MVLLTVVVSSLRLRISLPPVGVSSGVREDEGRESGEEERWGGRSAGVEKEGAGGALCFFRFIFLGG